VVATPILLVCLLFRRTRLQSAFLLTLAWLLIACCFFGIVLGQKARHAGMQAFTRRAQPLVTAIKAYERDHAAPPQTLADLVPKYIESIPTTGMMAYPEYEYHSGAEASERYAGNRWALSVATPAGGFNFDMMLYFPDQNYPTRGYGGWLQRIDDWAYVHE
ncbi:MAG: hypothetical protein ACREHD_20615, partial [Pirellulales bacterium]